jgi:two-component system chemotaxis sensor kinase CheA
MKQQPNDNDFISETLPIFISEAQEQIADFEQLLLQLEDAPQDRELLDALFRCAHTVKGSAGIFGLDAVVEFTHHVETLLDRLREGQVALTPELSTLLLRGNDEMRHLVSAAKDPNPAGDAGAQRARNTLVAQLQQASGKQAHHPAAAAAPEAPADSDAPAALQRWHLGVRFGSDIFRNGMDPVAILGYLRGLGTVSDLHCATEAVPPLDSLEPESCHLAFTFALDTAAAQAEIEAAFTFVREDCELAITAPARRPAADARLGQMLLHEGVITGPELKRALHAQADAATDAFVPRLGELLTQQSGVDPARIEAAIEHQVQRVNASKPAAADDNRYIRVHADRLDAVINLLGELVIAGAGAALMARQTKQRGLIEANLQMARLIEEIRNGTLQLRMVPIGETFSRFRRVVRDTASELGKDVALEIAGGETEMDKSVVERIADPLMHLVRNALDHGLEPAADRVAAGKPAQGRLTLSARHESGVIAIHIEDDGRGIHRQKVLQRAWDRGLVERGVVPPDNDILNLIFEAGFSTAEKVTNLSGRGVGMDVVRRNIQALRGSVTLHSVQGRGSRIEIRLPLTLAIIDGFLIGVGHSRFIFPLDAVVEVIEGRHDVNAAGSANEAHGRGRSVVELRGQMLPVVNLRTLYALDSNEPDRHSVVVLQAGGRRFGVRVDQLLGQHQTVIKPLGHLFSSLRGMSGSSILGNGEVALIFDVNALGQLAADAPGRVTATPVVTKNQNHAVTAEGPRS